MIKFNLKKFNELEENEIINIDGGVFPPAVIGVIITAAVTISIAAYNDSMKNAYQNGVNQAIYDIANTSPRYKDGFKCW